MSNQYLVKYSQRFDEVVYAVYGDLKLFEAILERNTHLLDHTHLETGDVVYLVDVPSINTSENKEENLKSIW